MGESKENLNQKIARLNKEVEWFYSDEFELDEAILKYEEAIKLAEEVEKDLNELKNKVEILKEKFDK